MNVKKLITNINKSLLLLAIVTAALTTNYIYAVWTGPTAAAPNGNTDAPINTGTAAQVKNGALSVNGLSVVGSQVVVGAAPSIEFTDTDHTDWWVYVNGNHMYFINDRNDDGVWAGESPWPLDLYAGSTYAYDYALFSNQVRANYVCDRNGNYCSTPAQIYNKVNSSGAYLSSGWQSGQNGGSGGTRTQVQNCPSGWVMTGIIVRSGWYVDSIGIYCQKLN